MAKAKSTEIKLSELLKDKFIELELESSEKRKIIAELAALVAQSKRLKNKKAFFDCLLEREALGSTGIGNGVAIPHAKTKVAADFIVALGRKTKGIDFGALDGEKTYLFFVLASPKDEVGRHLKILADISRIVKDKFTIDSLKQAKDKKEIIKIISIAEKRLESK